MQVILDGVVAKLEADQATALRHADTARDFLLHKVKPEDAGPVLMDQLHALEADRQDRVDKIGTVLADIKMLLDDLAVLEEDGYPDLRTFSLETPQTASLAAEVADAEELLQQFTATDTTATTLTGTFGSPRTKTPR